jgi:hypothetical protein
MRTTHVVDPVAFDAAPPKENKFDSPAGAGVAGAGVVVGGGGTPGVVVPDAGAVLVPKPPKRLLPVAGAEDDAAGAAIGAEPKRPPVAAAGAAGLRKAYRRENNRLQVSRGQTLTSSSRLQLDLSEQMLPQKRDHLLERQVSTLIQKQDLRLMQQGRCM